MGRFAKLLIQKTANLLLTRLQTCSGSLEQSAELLSFEVGQFVANACGVLYLSNAIKTQKGIPFCGAGMGEFKNRRSKCRCNDKWKMKRSSRIWV